MPKPVRVRIAAVIYERGGYCGLCDYEGHRWDACPDCRTTLLGYADAVMAELSKEANQ